MMNTKMEHSPAINPNPMLSVEKNGTVLYSNEAGEPLLREWGVTVGEKLPPYIGDVVQRVLCQNSPEKMEVEAGKRVYLIVFHPLSEEKCVFISGFDISDQKELEFKPLESEALEIANLELSEILDIQAVKPLMEDLYKLVHIPIGINDLKGNVLVGIGWQDICVKFHRVHPETYKHCVESDSKLSAGVLPGEFNLYKCKNNMYDIVTPIMLRSQQVGYVFSGQFFFDDEPLDYELFRSQAKRYGFNEEEYIDALRKVPRLSRETVNTGMSFFISFANLVSQLSYSNIKLSKSLSERDNLLEKLQVSEDKYRNIVETANEGVWVYNSVSETTYVNEKMAEMLGYNQEEIIGRFIWDFACEEEKGIFQVKLANRKLGIDEVYECKLLRKNGSSIWLLVSAKASFDKDGKFAGSLGMFTDITERKQAEEALKKAYDTLEEKVKERTAELEKTNKTLRESERSLAEAQRIAHFGNWDWNIVTNSLYWSDEIYRIFGRSPQEFGATYDAFLSYVHPDDREYVNNAVKEALNGKYYSIDHRIFLANGEERIVHEQGEVNFDKKNIPIRMRGTVQDITERKKAEEKVERLANIVEYANDGIGLITLEGIVLEWNKGEEQIYGYNAEDIVGRHISVIAHPHLKNEPMNYIEFIKQTRTSYNFTTSRLRKDGKTIDVSITLSPVFDSYGKLTAISFITRDISEQKMYEEKLRLSEEKYRIVAEQKGQLVYDYNVKDNVGD